MLTGVVIAESLRTDAQLDGQCINIARVKRVAVEGLRPRTRTPPRLAR
jgi:hypothetical protein